MTFAWLTSGLEDDIRPRMFDAAHRGAPFALATITAADGGPRPAGAQMVITRTETWGFLSGGCIEADVALHAREVIEGGEPRRIVYGKGSPFIDIRLPCGGRLDILVERIAADDKAIAELERCMADRKTAFLASDGKRRQCHAAGSDPEIQAAEYIRRYDPAQRLIVAGADPFALAIAGMGQQIEWETILLAPFGPAASVPFGLRCDRRPMHISLPELAPDNRTAIAVATHEIGIDQIALVPALSSDAGYVGVLGSRRKIGKRVEALSRAGLNAQEIERLRAPLGLAIGAESPWEVAVAVVGEIIAQSRRTAPPLIVTNSSSDVAR